MYMHGTNSTTRGYNNTLVKRVLDNVYDDAYQRAAAGRAYAARASGQYTVAAVAEGDAAAGNWQSGAESAAGGGG